MGHGDSEHPQEKPLVSFCLICHNQERFIAAALAGAFAQTYRPLEIVLMDDASTDRSWHVVAQEVAAYRARGGDIPVHLHRNPRNLGNLGNWLHCCSLARGELIVKADGDDVSLPERTARIVSAWLADGRRATLIGHGGWMITPSGHPLGPSYRASGASPIGALFAFTRAAMTFFGDAENPRLVDDEVCARRARMLGPELLLDDRLVLWRQGTGVSSPLFNLRPALVAGRTMLLGSLRQARRDLEQVRDRLSPADYADWLARLAADERRTAAELKLFASPTFRERLAGYRGARPAPPLSVWTGLKLAFLAPRCLGTPALFLYAALRTLLRRVNGEVRYRRMEPFASAAR
ncbi:MAG: glycosyltransferase family 2 protein [Kiritimatiellia bacterium]